MKRRTWRVAAVVPLLGVAATLLALSAGRGRVAARSVRDADSHVVGVARDADAANAVSAGEKAHALSVAAQATLGPHVGAGTFLGVSKAVADLPLPAIPVVTSVKVGDSENLVAAQGSASTAKDPVVQHGKGSGSLTSTTANFDGICLPGGQPCTDPSSCGCLPPDPNGAVGATQYVQMVNSDFAVYSKATGLAVRHATPIDELWSGTSSECAAHNDGDPVVVYDQYADRWLLSQFVAQPNTGESYAECI